MRIRWREISFSRSTNGGNDSIMKDERLRKLVKEYYLDKISDEVWHLIAFAKFDLWHGPFPANEEEKYPGFETACRGIKEGLRIVVDLYLDNVPETLQNNEPNCC